MNRNELARQLKQIDHDPDKFVQLKNFCIENSKQVLEITKVFEDNLHRTAYTLSYRMKVFQLMNQIMTDQRGSRFIRHFVTRIRSFLSGNSMEIALEGELCKKMITIFANWKIKKFFYPSFFQALKLAAGAILSRQTFEANYFVRYNKTFTMLFRDIHNTEAGPHLYKSICLKAKAKKDFEGIPDRLTEINGLDYQDRIQEARKLLQACEKKITLLVEAINEQQQGCKAIASMVLRELKELPMNQEMLTSEETQNDV